MPAGLCFSSSSISLLPCCVDFTEDYFSHWLCLEHFLLPSGFTTVTLARSRNEHIRSVCDAYSWDSLSRYTRLESIRSTQRLFSQGFSTSRSYSKLPRVLDKPSHFLSLLIALQLRKVGSCHSPRISLAIVRTRLSRHRLNYPAPSSTIW